MGILKGLCIAINDIWKIIWLLLKFSQIHAIYLLKILHYKMSFLKYAQERLYTASSTQGNAFEQKHACMNQYDNSICLACLNNSSHQAV